MQELNEMKYFVNNQICNEDLLVSYDRGLEASGMLMNHQFL